MEITPVGLIITYNVGVCCVVKRTSMGLLKPNQLSPEGGLAGSTCLKWSHRGLLCADIKIGNLTQRSRETCRPK